MKIFKRITIDAYDIQYDECNFALHSYRKNVINPKNY